MRARGRRAGPGGDSYRTFFQDPGTSRTPDLSLDNRAIALVAATPEDEQLRFTFRDFNSQPIAAAHGRGVDVRGVVDGGGRDQGPVRDLVREIGADRVVVCGSRGVFDSCIASADPPSLMHNKFMTFSRLYDAYAAYFADLQAQVRSADHYLIAPASGPNTIFTSPRFQPDRATDDTIVDRMGEIDCPRAARPPGAA